MINKQILRVVIVAGCIIQSLVAQQVATVPVSNSDARPGSTAVPAATEAIIRDVQFHSPSLDRDMKYRIILPADYARSAQRYPVLYLLHGLKGSYVDWESHTPLVQYLRGMDLIVVMPDGKDAWYSNSTSKPKDRFEDYIVKDLVAEIDARYRTLLTRQTRAIAGLSMGGYGAIKLALKYPQIFGFAGSFSGALNAATNLDLSYLPEQYTTGWLGIFGPSDSPMRAENDPLKLLNAADASALPYFYLDCGASDRFLKPNRDFVASLAEHKAVYQYHEVPGTHSWAYWDGRVPEMLRALAMQMDLRTAAN